MIDDIDSKQTSQSEKFKQAAHDLETDNEEKRFDRLLGKIAKAEKLKSQTTQHPNVEQNDKR